MHVLVRKVLWSFFSNYQASHRWLSYTIHLLYRTSQSNQEIIPLLINEDDSMKEDFFLYSSWSTHFWEVLHFAVCSKTERLLNGPSWVSWQHPWSSMISLHHVVPVDSWGSTTVLPLLRFSSRLSNVLSHHCIVYLLIVPGPDTLLVLWTATIALSHSEHE